MDLPTWILLCAGILAHVGACLITWHEVPSRGTECNPIVASAMHSPAQFWALHGIAMGVVIGLILAAASISELAGLFATGLLVVFCGYDFAKDLVGAIAIRRFMWREAVTELIAEGVLPADYRGHFLHDYFIRA